MHRDWLNGFADYFIHKYPDAPISSYPDLVEASAAILGQFWKLEYVAVLPEAEPSGFYGRASNWNPANLKVLQLATEHAAKGDKVLIGSSLAAYGPWLAEELCKHGVTAEHIVRERLDGSIQTLSPAKRADAVCDFRSNGTSVLCTTTQAMKLGHNLDTANVVIVHGLPWTYSDLDQFVARVHRLTSQRPVTVYIVMTAGTVDVRKWELVTQKGAATQLAIDGQLFDQDVQKIDKQQILAEMKKAGIKGDGALPESQIKRHWQRPPLSASAANNNDMAQQMAMFG